MKNWFFIFLYLIVSLIGCGDGKEIERLTLLEKQLKRESQSLRNSLREVQSQMIFAQKLTQRMNFLVSELQGIHARIETNLGDIELKFYQDHAPIHCFNFILRAESGFYENTLFHRVIPGFMIQGGDPNSKDLNPYNNGQGSPICSIPHEFNDMPHKRGVLSMARTSDKSIGAGSQFFILHKNSPQLDRGYTAFGEVLQGMSVVDKIATAETHKNDPRSINYPVKPVVIQKIKVYK